MLGLWARRTFRRSRHISLYIVPMILGTSSRSQFPSPAAIVCCRLAHSTGSSLLQSVGSVVVILHTLFIFFFFFFVSRNLLHFDHRHRHACNSTRELCVSPTVWGHSVENVGCSQRASSYSEALQMENRMWRFACCRRVEEGVCSLLAEQLF